MMWSKEGGGGVAALILSKAPVFDCAMMLLWFWFCHFRGKEVHQACQDLLGIR